MNKINKIDGDDNGFSNVITPVENLLLNMSGGLLPEELSAKEQEMLREAFGPDWFAELGYSEPEYRRPREGV